MYSHISTQHAAAHPSPKQLHQVGCIFIVSSPHRVMISSHSAVAADTTLYKVHTLTTPTLQAAAHRRPGRAPSRCVLIVLSYTARVEPGDARFGNYTPYTSNLSAYLRVRFRASQRRRHRRYTTPSPSYRTLIYHSNQLHRPSLPMVRCIVRYRHYSSHQPLHRPVA
jgi:hypothetical protein